MKCFLILASFFAVAYAGVGITTDAIEAEALRLWAAYCDGASEGGTDGSTFIYCKRSRDNYEETLQHNIELPQSQGGQQVVFVQPPSYHYKHNVIVTGGGGQAPKTVIYVKPSHNTNQVSILDQTAPNQAPAKPQLFFLTGKHGSGSETQVGAQPQQPQQGYNYNAPSRGLKY